jgi:hypothetical protein
MASIREVDRNPSNTWDEESWINMSQEEQELWGILGWDEDSWEEETDPPKSSDLYWDDLTNSERDAATKLGYTQDLWDEE